MQKRLTLWAALLIIAALVLSGCAPRTGAGSSAAMAMDDELVIDLPAIVIDFDTNGHASIGGIPAAEMGAMAGADLSTLALSPDWVSYFSMTNIQHLQVNNAAEGLGVLVNGQPVPSLEWDENSLVATAGALESLGIAVPVLDKVLPLVQQLGIGVIMRFLSLSRVMVLRLRWPRLPRPNSWPRSALPLRSTCLSSIRPTAATLWVI
jgi:hypothetical protein